MLFATAAWPPTASYACAAQRQALPVGGREGRPGGVVHRDDRQVGQDRQRHQRHHQPLAPGDGRLRRPDGEHVGRVGVHLGHERRQRARPPLHVGVGEEQDLPLRGLGQLPAGPIFADPAAGQRRPRQHAQPRVAGRRGAGGRGRAVLRMVVENQELKAGVILRQQARDGVADDRGFVAGGDEDGDEGRVGGQGARFGAQAREEQRVGDGRDADDQQRQGNARQDEGAHAALRRRFSHQKGAGDGRVRKSARWA
jgi:hypothetical protein